MSQRENQKRYSIFQDGNICVSIALKIHIDEQLRILSTRSQDNQTRLMEDLLKEGIAQAKQGDYETAIASYERAISSNLELSEAYYRRGLAYFELNKLERAIADYDRSLNLDGKQVNVYFSRATAFLAGDKIQSCIIDLQIIFSLDANYDKAYKLRANVCIRLKEDTMRRSTISNRQGKYISPVRIKKAVVFVLPASVRIEQQKIAERGGVTNQMFWRQIQQKIGLGNLGEAFRDCNWLLQLDPYDAQAYQCRGNISIELGEHQQAKQDFHQAAKCFRTQGDLASAERLERRCLELQLKSVYRQPQPELPRLVRTPNPQNAIENRLYVLVGSWKIAQSLVEKLMQRYPGEAETWYWEKAIYDIERDRL